MKLYSIFLFLIFYNQINYSCSRYSYVYTIEEIYKILNNIKADESDLKIIVDSFITLFNEAYAYTEVAKNPPQPSFNSTYFEKVDIIQGLKNIPIKNTNMFKFYQELKLLFDKLGDQHLSIKIDSSKLKDLYFECPIQLDIREYNYKFRIFGKVRPNKDNYIYFRNNEEVFNIIKKNIDVPITKINGKDPFDYITEFGGSYEKFKSPQGTFRFKMYEQQIEKPRNFFDYPLPPEEFYNFTVEYQNGDNFTTDFVIYSSYNLTQNSFNNDIKSFAANIKKKKEANVSEIYRDIITFGSKRLYEKLYGNEKNTKSSFAESMNWDYRYSDEIACKADNEKRINIYAVLSFGGASPFSGFINTVSECTKLFDGNKYPIMVVNIMNGGGLLDNSQFLIETVSPKTTVNIYAAFRNKGLFKDTTFGNQIVSTFLDIDNCESLSYKAFKKKSKNIDYGNSVSDDILGPIFLSGMNVRRQTWNLKDQLINPRKPTDIILFTDGFSYSATSLFLKFLQYYGGAITVGYYPNPNLEKIPYDSSLSPSSILTQESLAYLNASGLNELKKYNYSFILTGSQAFYTPNDFTHPLEYEVTPVDEKVNVYISDTSNSYERMNNKDNYEVFIEHALAIINKYKTQCNKDNKKLLNITEECDGQFENSYTHGGYVCGDNGYWTKTCVASYCDFGYVFDHTKKKCIVDACKPEDVEKSFYIIITVILVILVGSIIAFIICYIIQNKRKQERLKQYNIQNNEGLINDNASEEKTDV
jgi:hypothetical protein